MGISTNANIAYGILLGDDFELPWDEDEEDLDTWYCRTVHEKDFAGNYRGMLEFLRDNPLPFQLENYCSGEYPMYALVVTGTVKMALRGGPKTFHPAELVVDPAALEKFTAAIDVFGTALDKSSIGWFLYSYMS